MNPTQHMFRRVVWFRVCVIFLTLLFLSCNAVASPDAGSRIQNQASLSYFNPNLDQREIILSDIVVLQVRAVPSFVLQGSTEKNVTAGESVIFAHTLINTGNIADEYQLRLDNLSDDGFDFTQLQVFVDANQNGVIDDDESPITAITLEPDESTALLVRGVTPENLPNNTVGQLQLQALPGLNDGGKSPAQTVVDTAISQTTNGVETRKTASPSNVQPGDTITFDIALNIFDPSSLDGIEVVLDGQELTAVVLRDAIPLNTQYVATVETNLVFHAVGSPLHEYQTARPPATEIDAVALLFVDDLPSSTRLSFSVRVNTNASSDITNQAFLYDAATVNGQGSNTTQTNVNNGSVAELAFYADNNFNDMVSRTGLGDPLFVQVNAAACNQDASRREQYELTLTSNNTDDQEVVVVTETAANSGVFQVGDVATSDANQTGVSSNNTVLEILANGQIQADLTCAEITLQSHILVDPFGVVFDSRTNQPIAGATVTLIDVTGENNGGNPGEPAIVFAADGITPAPSTVITGEDGRFEFPLVAPGTYRLAISPPVGYAFPSELAVDDLPSNRIILTPGSYGGDFVVSESIVQLDVPLDAPVGSLFVTVTASPNELEYGQASEVCVTVVNFSGQALTNVTVNLDLPAGYLADDLVSPISLLDLAIGERQRICYTVTAGPNAITNGDITATATGFDGITTLQSNTARTELQLKQEQFYGTILGRVFVDCDEDRVQGNEEPGIPQVRVVLNNGQWAVTDSEGMYSFGGLPPQTYVLRVDELTLPAAAELEVLDTRNGGDPRSRWVDLRRYDLHKANFADGSCSEDLLAEVAARRQAVEVLGVRNTGQLWQSLDRRLQLNTTSENLQRLPAASHGDSNVAEHADGHDGTNARSRGINRKSTASSIDTNASIPTLILAESLQARPINNELAFMNVRDGMVWDQSQMTIQVKGRLGATIQLKINGNEIPTDMVGKRVDDSQQKLVISDYIGVPLQPGDNQLQLRALDSFGNVREEVSAAVTVAGKPTQLVFILPETLPIADGETPTTIGLELQDAAGLRVGLDSPVSLGIFIPQPSRVNSRVQWLNKDLNVDEAKTQVMLENGQASLQLSAPVEPARIKLLAEIGTIQAKQTLLFKPHLRPLMLVGSLEGGGNQSQNASQTDQQSDYGFAAMPSQWSTQRGDSQLFGRASLYAKGAIGSETLLTARYDSESQQEALFNDIDPDRFYPVYGDAAIRGFDARSTSQAYVRLDRGQSWGLYGDYTTAFTPLQNRHFKQTTQTDLGRFNRAVTGVQSGLLLNEQADWQTQLNFFAAEADSQQRVEELPALGISGPYQLSAQPLANSEQITVLVRDREQPAIILQERRLQRFTDYVLNTDTGELILRQPLASVTGIDLHPQSLLIAYEIETNVDDAMLVGVSLQQNFQRGQAMVSSIRDEAELEPYQLHSLQGKWQVSDALSLSVEQARSEGSAVDTGDASRAEILAEYARLRAKLSVYKTDRGFANPSARSRRGRIEWRLDSSLRLSPRVVTNLQLLDSKDDFSGSELTGTAVNLLWNVTDQLQLDTSIRHSDDSSQDDDYWTAGLRARLNMLVAERNFGINLGIEVDPDNTDRRLLDIGLDYAVSNDTRLYARHELASTLNSRFSLDDTIERDTTTVGIESSAAALGLGGSNSRLFSEYRARNAFDGRAAEAAIGLRNRWQITPEWRLDASLENIRGLNNETRVVDNFAFTTGVRYQPNEGLITTARVEYRDTNGNERWFSSLGLAWKLNRRWSLLNKWLWNRQILADVNRDEARLLLGLAWRNPDDDAWNGLFKYEYRLSDGANDSGNTTDSSRLMNHRIRSNLHWQPTGNWHFSQYGVFQYADSKRSSAESSSQTIIQTGLRSRYQLAEHWDVAALTAAQWDDQERYRAAIGLELGWLVAANLWLNVGYNFTGFNDQQVDGEAETAKGSYFRIRFKFDEQTFGLGAE